MSFFKSLGYTYRRIRRVSGGSIDALYYEQKVACLQELEALSERGSIDLYYGDQTGVSTEGYCPYGWQGKEEKVSVVALPRSHQRLNCMGWINRHNRFYYATTTENINGDFVFEHLEWFSWQVRKKTVLVLDNARIHKTPAIKAQMKVWESRGLQLFFLPPYSPHLNIVETLGRMLKGRWLSSDDYRCADTLFNASLNCLNAVGNSLSIKFSSFTSN